MKRLECMQTLPLPSGGYFRKTLGSGAPNPSTMKEENTVENVAINMLNQQYSAIIATE